MKEFSNRLISLRKERGCTQEEIAQALQKKRSTVAGYETGGKEPDMKAICTLAQYFGVSTDYLLGYSDERNHTESAFFNDTIEFETHFRALPDAMRPTVANCFASLYALMDMDVKKARLNYLYIYEQLFNTLRQIRANIRQIIDSTGMMDSAALTDLMTMQNRLKNEVAALLDKLMQNDMEQTLPEKTASKSA